MSYSFDENCRADRGGVRRVVYSERRPEDDCYALSARRQVLRPPVGLGAWCLDRADRHAGLFFERSAWVVGGHAKGPVPHTREFRASLQRIAEMPDSLAERAGFEPSYMDPAPVASRSID